MEYFYFTVIPAVIIPALTSYLFGIGGYLGGYLWDVKSKEADPDLLRF